jgi:hypothetical protein
MVGSRRMKLQNFREFVNCIELCKIDMVNMRWRRIIQIIDNQGKNNLMVMGMLVSA